jgi:cell wall-associated NlpC family hydrolase
MGPRKVFLLLIVFVLLSGCSAGRKARTAKIESVIGTARSYTGTPYRYGGMTRGGMDCSGLLVVSFRSADMQIPRTSREQAKFGKKVRIDEIKPGDMVFFAAKKRRRKVSHAGLVTRVEGNKSVTFIHASTSLGVIETELYTDYYRAIFVKAVRPKY